MRKRIKPSKLVVSTSDLNMSTITMSESSASHSTKHYLTGFSTISVETDRERLEALFKR